MDGYDPEYVLILSGDHIYKMDYEAMLDFHKQNQSDATLAVFPVPWEEASRFGVGIADEEKRIQDFEEKPENPRSNLASMGIYIFSWPVLKEALVALKDQSNCDFGQHIIPHLHKQGKRIFAYEFNGYWKDVGTLGSYWEANMELIDLIPEFNLYEEFWKIYTKQDRIEPQFIGANASVSRAIIGAGDSIEGEVSGSVLGAGVVVEEGAVVKDSIIMMNTTIHKGAYIEKAVIAEDCEIGADTRIGVGESAESKLNASVYAFDLAVVGQGTVIPDGVTIGKNTAIRGVTVIEDYPDKQLESGGYIIKAGDGA
jgi:glucose-1-phosphate adenylyltransferase